MTTPASDTVPVLRSAETQQQLNRNGYTVIPLLSPDEVAQMLGLYRSQIPDDEAGMVVDYMRPDRGFMRTARTAVDPLLDTRFADVLEPFRAVLTTFAIKHPGGEETSMFLHDDRSFVPEGRFRTATLWIPLVDVGPDIPNGGLQVIPRSHLLPTGLSGSYTPDQIRPFEHALRPLLISVAVPAGHALVYDTRLLHASPPNRSEEARVALICAVAPIDAPLIHVVATGRRTRRVHPIDPDLFVEHHIRDMERAMPEEYPLASTYQDETELSPARVAEILDIPAPTSRPVIPEDLADDVPCDADFHGHPVAVRPGLEDLLLAAGDLRPISAASQVGATKIRSGVAGWTPVRRRGRPTQGHASKLLRDRVDLPRSAIDADAVVLEPGARLDILPRGGALWSTHLTVAECPTVGAGARAGHRGANLDLARRLELPVDQTTTVWNDGPGMTAVILSRSPAIALLPSRLRTGQAVLPSAGSLARAARTRLAAWSHPSPPAAVAAHRPPLAERFITGFLAFDERLVNSAIPPVDAPLDATVPPWAGRVRSQWPTIRAELDALIEAGVQMPETNDLVGSDQGADGRWTTFVMTWYGNWMPAGDRCCPKTAALLRTIPGIQVAGFTVLGPHTRIPLHQGPAKSYRWQMGMRVPGPEGSSGLRIGDDDVSWAEGAVLAFDDRTPHEAWNDADESRYVLFIQVPWPVTGARGIVHRSIQRSFGAATSRIGRRAAALDRSLNPPARP